MRNGDRLLAFLLAVGVLASVFVLRACRNPRTPPADLVPAAAPAQGG